MSNVYLGRKSGESDLEQKSLFEAFSCSVDLCVGVPNVCKNLLLVVQDKQCVHESVLLFEDPPSVYLGRH